MAVVKISTETRDITEYDVQPKSEEDTSINFKFILTTLIISSIVTVGLYFTLQMLGL